MAKGSLLQGLVSHASSLAATALALPSPTHFAIPSQPLASRLHSVDSGATSVLDTASKIVDDVAQVLNNIPYLQILAGLVKQILDIKEV
jgi:hypothetical protein